MSYIDITLGPRFLLQQFVLDIRIDTEAATLSFTKEKPGMFEKSCRRDLELGLLHHAANVVPPERSFQLRC